MYQWHNKNKQVGELLEWFDLEVSLLPLPNVPISNGGHDNKF